MLKLDLGGSKGTYSKMGFATCTKSNELKDNVYILLRLTILQLFGVQGVGENGFKTDSAVQSMAIITLRISAARAL